MSQEQNRAVRPTFWAAATFYLFIGMEFIYMATPFAMYFYSVYRPALSIVGDYPALAWLSGFFLPHFVIDTTSDLLNARNAIGIVFAVLGLLLFAAGASQVYYHKLTRKGAVTGGIYTLIRHPQYASLMLSSFGFLILWPRYLVLISFVTMLFAYYFLARREEKECEKEFGDSYLEYKGRTGMFIPLPFPEFRKARLVPARGAWRIAAIAGMYFAVLTGAVGSAYLLKTWSLGQVYALYDENAAFVSMTRVTRDSLNGVVASVLGNEEVKRLMQPRSGGNPAKYIGYVLPPGYYAMEIPMIREDSVERFHFMKISYDRSSCRVIITEAADAGSGSTGKGILLTATRRVPVLEAWVDLRTRDVMRVASLAGQSGVVRMPGPTF